ncbi:hypothetical protein SSPO_026410 [Streptomyces antimycoticus]|uniref:Uncharacterized protein n=1 Tax=Streptomyces antimycoticus TaxID=68175 RepID=A0A499UF38_9ACTN|nr:hypothetical protein SSPO_026410 [Streptomyces antimycoticus]
MTAVRRGAGEAAGLCYVASDPLRYVASDPLRYVASDPRRDLGGLRRWLVSHHG